MVPELQEAAKDPAIQAALREKISRERVGEELDKMMGGRNPLLAIDLINSLSLYSSVFTVPESAHITLSETPSSPQNALKAAMLLHVLTNPTSTPNTLSGLPFPSLPAIHPLLLSDFAAPSSTSRRLYLASALTPYRELTYTQAKGKVRPAAEAVIREGIKLGAQHHYLDGIPALFAAAELVQRGVADFEAARFDKPERAWIGVLLREKNVHNPLAGSVWSTSLLFALVQELTVLWGDDTHALGVDAASKRIAAYNQFAARIEELDLPKAVDAKSILDGREVVKVLGAASPGPWTGQVLARVVEWQLEHPQGTKEECETWLRAEQAAGNISTAGGKRVKDGAADAKAKKAKR